MLTVIAKLRRRSSPISASISRSWRTLREHHVAAGSNRRHRHPQTGAGAQIRRRRLCRPRFRPIVRCAPLTGLCTVRRAGFRRAGALRRRRRRPRVGAHRRGRARASSIIEQCLARLADGPVVAEIEPSATARAMQRGHRAGRRVPRRHPGLGAHGRPRHGSPTAICAIRRGSSGRCWRRRSRATSSPISRSATNRSTAPIPGTTCEGSAVRKLLFKSLVKSPLTEPAPPADDAMLAELASRLAGGVATQARAQPVHSRGRCRLLQRLRARDPCAQQCLSTTSSASGSASSPRRAMPTCCSSPGRSLATCAKRWSAPMRATPDPKWVVAVGDCGFDGGVFAGSYALCRRRLGRYPGRSAYPRLSAEPDRLAARIDCAGRKLRRPSRSLRKSISEA